MPAQILGRIVGNDCNQESIPKTCANCINLRDGIKINYAIVRVNIVSVVKDAFFALECSC